MLVEGPTDAAVARRLLAHANLSPGDVFGQNGIGYIKKKLEGFAVRVQFGAPLLVLVDCLDLGIECVRDLSRQLISGERPSGLLLRGVVPQIESWLLADRPSMAAHLSVSLSRIPLYPEHESNAKQTLVNIARHSRNKRVREAIVPSAGASVGPGYVASMIEFATNKWNPHVASGNCDSLARCIRRLREIV